MTNILFIYDEPHFKCVLQKRDQEYSMYTRVDGLQSVEKITKSEFNNLTAFYTKLEGDI